MWTRVGRNERLIWACTACQVQINLNLSLKHPYLVLILILGNYSLQQISGNFIVYTCLYIIISICLLNVVNVIKVCLKIPVFPKSGNIV